MYNYIEYEKFWNNPISDYKQLLEPYLLTMFESYKNSSVLEIGFGSAHLPYLLENISFTGKYLGIDIDSKAVEMAQKIYSSQEFSFEAFAGYEIIKSKSWDLAIFCLSACEMSDDVIINYLRNIKAKKILIINPSTITNYFDSKISKPLINKITSRLGRPPKWKLIANIPSVLDDKRLYYINNNLQIPASMYYRSTGDLLNLLTQTDYIFEHYKDLKYYQNSIKTAPVSKFEIMLFESSIFDKKMRFADSDL